jgi:uncharacterized membrane protein (DUF106 family)
MAAVVAVCFSLINKVIVDQKRLADIKKQMNDYQKEYAKAQKEGNKELVEKLDAKRGEMMGMTKEIMTSSFKPMMFTFIPAIAIIGLMNSTFTGTGNIVKLPILGWELGWFWWYVVVSLLAGICVEIVYKAYAKQKKEKESK